MRSRYPGRCPVCHQPYPVGTEIVKDEVSGLWVMASCLAGKQQAAHQAVLPSSLMNVQALAGQADGHVDEGRESKPAPHFKPSPYQRDLFNEISHQTAQHVVVMAGPGSGKTTTIVEALSLTPKDAEVAFLAYNRHIAKELQRRSPAHVHVSTLHSLGLAAIRRWKPNIEVDDDKLSGLMSLQYPIRRDEEPSSTKRAENRRKRSMLRRMVSLSKAILVDAEDRNATADMVDRYNLDIDYDVMDELLDFLPALLDMSKTLDDVVDYDDMIWFPIVHDISCPKFDYLFVDEAQDLNASQIELLMRSLADDGRIIAVGDPYQSLYAFRGADADAMPNIINRLHAKVMPLSISYRCPSSHIDHLNEVMGRHVIEAAPNAKIGVLGELLERDLVKTLASGDMVLCRTNAPLIEPAFACVRAGKKAIIRGRDIGKALIELIEKFQADDLDAFETSLREWFVREYDKFLNKGKELQAELVKDKYDTLLTVMAECESGRTVELIDKVERLFSDDSVGIVFSSVHRAKGLEADRVFILHPELMPHPKAKQPWEVEQERNCIFVAFSRSKSELYTVK